MGLHGFLDFMGHTDKAATRKDNKVFIGGVSGVVVRGVA